MSHQGERRGGGGGEGDQPTGTGGEGDQPTGSGGGGDQPTGSGGGGDQPTGSGGARYRQQSQHNRLSLASSSSSSSSPSSSSSSSMASSSSIYDRALNEDLFDGLITPSMDKTMFTDELKSRPTKFLGANLRSWLILLLIIAVCYITLSLQSFVDYSDKGPDALVAAVYSGAGNVKG